MSDSNDSCTPLTEMQSYTSSSTGIDTLEPPYANDPAGSRCESEEYSEIIPKLRSMTHQDQEKFFKRAEKLEKMFGSIPTSTLIESSLTTPHAAGQRPRSPFQPPPSVSRAAAMAATAAAADNHGSDQRGLVELAEFWASGNSSSGGSSSSEDGRTSEDRELVRRSFSEEIVESLAMISWGTRYVTHGASAKTDEIQKTLALRLACKLWGLPPIIDFIAFEMPKRQSCEMSSFKPAQKVATDSAVANKSNQQTPDLAFHVVDHMDNCDSIKDLDMEDEENDEPHIYTRSRQAGCSPKIKDTASASVNTFDELLVDQSDIFDTTHPNKHKGKKHQCSPSHLRRL
ncbi:hypothetical protein BGW38_007316 [Lunasporangiospora selenospora]|uniref:Uncharacterized protein n=1 Tax=Lunasporangiospora selenospora TaxID=979761 RepID=A0A9P6FLH2_9FUNG|nr:hypothetical protein BGW38_007316 [Lunasporangiospora selenospora]